MRTTVTLNADLASEVERIRRQDGRDFDAVLNDLLRRGLDAMNAESNKVVPPLTRPIDIGPARVDIVSTGRILDELDLREQRGLLDHIGTLDWDESYDYKAERSRRQES